MRVPSNSISICLAAVLVVGCAERSDPTAPETQLRTAAAGRLAATEDATGITSSFVGVPFDIATTLDQRCAGGSTAFDVADCLDAELGAQAVPLIVGDAAPQTAVGGGFGSCEDTWKPEGSEQGATPSAAACIPGQPVPRIASEVCRITSLACIHVAAGRGSIFQGCPASLSFTIFDATHGRPVTYTVHRTGMQTDVFGHQHGHYAGTAVFPGYEVIANGVKMRITCVAGYMVLTARHGGSGGGAGHQDPTHINPGWFTPRGATSISWFM